MSGPENRDEPSREAFARPTEAAHERFLAEVVEQSFVAMAVADLGGRILHANPAWAKMHGYGDAGEVLGAHLSVFHTPEQLEADVLPFNELVATRGSHTGEVGHVRRDGSTFPTLMTTTLLRDEHGAPAAIAGTATDITPLKDAERSLAESESEARAVLDALPVGVLVLRASDNRVLVENPAMRAMAGGPLQRFADQPETAYAHAGDGQRLRQALAEHGAVHGFQTDMRRVDGSAYPAVLDIVQRQRGDERVWLIVCRDVSTHREAELRFQLAAEAATDLIYEWDVRTDELRWFGDIDAALGHPPGTLPHTLEAWLGLIHPDDLVRLADAAERHRTSTELIRYEYRIRTADGSWRWWRDNGLPELDPDRRPIKWIGGCQDITEQRLAHRQLEEVNVELERRVAQRTGQLEALNRILRGAIGGASDEHVAALCLAAATELTGSQFGFVGELVEDGGLDVVYRSAGERERPHAAGVTHRLSGVAVPDFLARVIRRGRPMIVQDVAAHPGHVDIPGPHPPLRNLLLVPVHHGDRFTGVIGLANREGLYEAGDRETVEALSAGFVEALLGKRAELALLKSNRELDAANRELEAFAYSVSHDLRGPLRNIGGFAELLDEDAGDRLDDVSRGYLSRIRANTTHMSSLVDEILTLSKVARAELTWERVDLSALAASTLEALAREDPEREVQTDIAPELLCHGDPVLLRTVLENLLSNAWKYTAQRETAHITVGRQDENGERVWFVRDDGAGFDMAHADRLFGAFQRLHPQRDFPGTGVGLAIVQRAVERHGGRVWAVGAVDEGATFSFTLPERD